MHYIKVRISFKVAIINMPSINNKSHDYLYVKGFRLYSSDEPTENYHLSLQLYRSWQSKDFHH